MKNKIFTKFMIVMMMVLALPSCTNTPPSESVIKIIDTVENQLYP